MQRDSIKISVGKRRKKGNLRVNFCGEEKTEGFVRLDRVQLLLQFFEPLRCEMNVLQQDPIALLGGCIDRVFGLREAFSRTDSNASQMLVQMRG